MVNGQIVASVPYVVNNKMIFTFLEATSFYVLTGSSSRTGHVGVGVTILDLYSGGILFETRSDHRLSSLTFFVVIFSLPMRMPEYYLEIGHDVLFQILTYSPACSFVAV
jgi:hypothetical protein